MAASSASSEYSLRGCYIFNTSAQNWCSSQRFDLPTAALSVAAQSGRCTECNCVSTSTELWTEFCHVQVWLSNVEVCGVRRVVKAV